MCAKCCSRALHSPIGINPGGPSLPRRAGRLQQLRRVRLLVRSSCTNAGWGHVSSADEPGRKPAVGHPRSADEPAPRSAVEPVLSKLSASSWLGGTTSSWSAQQLSMPPRCCPRPSAGMHLYACERLPQVRTCTPARAPLSACSHVPVCARLTVCSCDLSPRASAHAVCLCFSGRVEM